jgi:hypothetical protein
MRKILALLLAVMLALIPAGSALAATSDTVTITMTGGTLSISTGSPTYGFGTVIQGQTYSTATTQFTVTNNGTVTVDIDIYGADTTGGSPSWTLSDTATPGAEIYGLKFERDTSPGLVVIPNNDGTPPDATDYMDGLSSGAGSNTDKFGLQLLTPTSITDITNLQQAVITLTATQA